MDRISVGTQCGVRAYPVLTGLWPQSQQLAFTWNFASIDVSDAHRAALIGVLGKLATMWPADMIRDVDDDGFWDAFLGEFVEWIRAGEINLYGLMTQSCDT